MADLHSVITYKDVEYKIPLSEDEKNYDAKTIEKYIDTQLKLYKAGCIPKYKQDLSNIFLRFLEMYNIVQPDGFNEILNLLSYDKTYEGGIVDLFRLEKMPASAFRLKVGNVIDRVYLKQLPSLKERFIRISDGNHTRDDVKGIMDIPIDVIKVRARIIAEEISKLQGEE